MSLAAVPVYLLVRRLGGGAWAALAAAALTVASPDLFFSSFVLADPIAYPLVLGAVYVGVCALAEPSRRLQLGFAALAVLATFARIQYVFLPLVFVAAALVVERGSVRTVWSRFRLSVLLYAAPLAFAAVLGPEAAARLLLRRRRPARQARRDRPLARHRRDAARLRGRLRARPGRDRRHRVRPLEAELARGVRASRRSRSACCSGSSPRRRSTRPTAPTASRSAT